MKKMKFLMGAVIILASVAFSSCKDCQTCTKGSSSTGEICKDDYGSKALYDSAIRSYKSQGYKCK